MSLDTLPEARGESRPAGRTGLARSRRPWRGADRINRRGSLEPREPGAPRRSLVLALVLSSLALMALDHIGDGSPLAPARRVAGEVVGPAQAAADVAMSPFLAVPRWLHRQDGLVEDVARLEAENARLRAELNSAPYAANRLAEYEGLTSSARQLGHALVPARVIGIGPAQSFSRTVTIDAGSDAGVVPDLTVVNAHGLVGRVIRVTATTATVLTLVDSDSVVGGRVGESLEMGFLRGRGGLGGVGSTLELELVDQETLPARGDTVVTWGSNGGAPYVAGVPVGRIVSVRESVRDTTRRAVIEPFVDFSALDVVGVVTQASTESDRALIEGER